MREIKFRLWDLDNQKMVKNISFDFYLTWDPCIGNEGKLIPFSNHECIIMQYTGKKDKNGVEIYEGDIVENRYCGKVYEIVWDNESSTWSQKIDNNYRSFFMDWAKDKKSEHNIEIIGNIYENTELLSKGIKPKTI